MSTAIFDAETLADITRAPRPRAASRHDALAATAGATALHPTVFHIAGGAYALMIAVFWFGFVTSGMLAVAMAIVTVSFVGYVGLPWSMAVMARRFKGRHGMEIERHDSFRSFLVGHFETGAGNVSGFEALVLVTTVPVCLLGASIALAVIYNTLA